MAHRENNATQQAIIDSAVRNFLTNGFRNTSAKMICNDVGISPGNLTFWFPTKADILLEFTKKIMNYHKKFIEYNKSKGAENLYTYCLEIVVQTALCEERENIRDIYYSMYSEPLTMAFLKDWTAEKNLDILGSYLPDWDLTRFRRATNVTCCIERSALSEPCTEDYTLEDKIWLTLTCLLKIYDFEKEDRETVISQILATDYHKIKNEMLKQLDEFLE
jgi:AcrR family transcriptional regulator